MKYWPLKRVCLPLVAGCSLATLKIRQEIFLMNFECWSFFWGWIHYLLLLKDLKRHAGLWLVADTQVAKHLHHQYAIIVMWCRLGQGAVSGGRGRRFHENLWICSASWLSGKMCSVANFRFSLVLLWDASVSAAVVHSLACFYIRKFGFYQCKHVKMMNGEFQKHLSQFPNVKIPSLSGNK